MQLGRVRGNVVSTLKHDALEGHRLLLVQLHHPDGTPRDAEVLAVDVADAGEGDWVLVLDEGASASQVLERPRGPVRTLIVGVVDAVDLPGAGPGPGGDPPIDATTRG